MIVTMTDADAAEFQAVIESEGQTALDGLRFREDGRRKFLAMAGREWRVKAERTPDNPGSLIVRTASGRTFIGNYPDDLSL